jgi:glutamyl-tRNA reductase
MIDISMPPNIDATCEEIDGVYLYNIDALQGVVDTNVQGRQQEAERAEEIVRQEVETYLQWERSLDAVPTIVDLREKVEDLRKRELDKTLCQLNGISDEQRRAVEILSQSIVNKMLHAPLVVLKQAAANPEGSDVIAVARKIFNLDRELKKPSHDHAKGFGAAENKGSGQGQG